MARKLLYDRAVDLTESASSVGLVGVDVHSERELLAYSYYYVAEYEGTSGVKLNANDLLIRNAELSSVCGSHMYVTLSSDNAFLYLNRAARTLEDAGAASCDVARLANGSNNADGACVSKRKLNLICRTRRSENACLKSALGALNGNLLLACELTGLAKILLICECVTLTEKDLKSFCSYASAFLISSRSA